MVGRGPTASQLYRLWYGPSLDGSASRVRLLVGTKWEAQVGDPRAVTQGGCAQTEKECVVEQNVRIPVDLTRAQYLVTANAGPKIADRRTGQQKVDRNSDLPMWTTELTQIGANGARVIQVTTVGQTAPAVSVGATVI